ncbi:MAG: hypothetical protein V3V12_02745 [Gammaproteobacteria bacterium]
MTDELSLERFVSLKLGESETELELETADDLCHATDLMVQQTQHSLEIFTRDMDEAVYNRAPFLESIRLACVHNRQMQIRMLVQQSQRAVTLGHRFIELARKMSSSIEIRQVHDDYQQYNQAFLISDQVGLIKKPFADRFEAIANFNTPVIAARQREFFTEVWGKSTPDPDMRRLHI